MDRPRFLLPFVFAALLSWASARGEMRKWSDASGKYRVEAEFLELTATGILLRNPAGKTLTVPLARFSAADQAFAQALAAQAAAAAAVPPVPPPAADGRAGELAFSDALTQPPAWVDAAAPFDVAAFLTGPPPQDNAAPL